MRVSDATIPALWRAGAMIALIACTSGSLRAAPQNDAATATAADPGTPTGTGHDAPITVRPAITSAAPASAAAPEAVTPDELRLMITPYVWAAGIDGTISNKGISTSFDVSFSDVLRNLDIAAMLHAELRWRRLFMYGDFVYVNLSTCVDINEPLLTSADVPALLSTIPANDPSFGNGPLLQAIMQADGDLNAIQDQLSQVSSEIQAALVMLTPDERAILAQLANNRLNATKEQAQLDFANRTAEDQAAILAALAALSPGPQLSSVQSKMTMTIAEFGGGYTLIDWDLGRPTDQQHIFGAPDQASHAWSGDSPALRFDLLASARYYNMGYDTTIMFTPDKFNILPAIVESDQRFEWVDAVIGGRIAFAFNREFRIWCRGDVGGVQAKQNSWNVQGGLEWAPASWFALVAGYRALHIDYQERATNGFSFNGTLEGPFLGCTFTF